MKVIKDISEPLRVELTREETYLIMLGLADYAPAQKLYSEFCIAFYTHFHGASQ